jgi:GNAT superfamily N-acetyltransferase
MIKNFEDLWQAHFEWAQGVLLKQIKPLKTTDIYFGYPPTEWFNFALPKVEKPERLDLNEIKKVLSPVSPPTAVYLHEEHVKAGFPEFLTKNGYQFMGTDTWMVLDKKISGEIKIDIPVEHINLAKFSDYDELTHEVFKQEGYDDPTYNKICRQSLTGEMKSKVLGFSSEFFMIYENGKPASGAGLFLTKEIGYFHNDATYKQYRKKGYQTALIKERIKLCLERNIKTIYSIVEKDSQSFRNFERCGFKTWQVYELFTLKV